LPQSEKVFEVDKIEFGYRLKQATKVYGQRTNLANGATGLMGTSIAIQLLLELCPAEPTSKDH